jgi:antitoxin component YwqK of YwqJK toxin-antitoxin module
MKSILFSILFVLIPKICLSQDITANDDAVYLDSLFNMGTEKNYKYIRVVKDYKNANQKSYEVKDFYKSGKIAMSGTTSKRDKIIKTGTFVYYYENGNIKQESYYVDNKLSGKQIDWYENNIKKSEKEIVWDSKTEDYNIKTLQFWNKEGQQTAIDGNGQFEDSDDKVYEKGELKNGVKQGIWEGKNLKEKFSFTEIYNEGKFISGVSTDENNTKYPYKELITKPTPAKGMSDFYSHIGKNYKTPDVQGLKGKIYTTFVIDTDGSITNIRVLRDVGYGSGKEAIRVIASYGKWIPGKMRGINTKATYSIPLNIQTSNSNHQNQGPTFESEMARNTNRNW